MTARILLVEDDALVAAALARFLRHCGHAVEVAADLQRARDSFAAGPPDVAIVDYELPDGTAFSLLQHCHATDSSTAFIVLTGHGTIELAVDAIKLGAEQFLTKPINLKSLELIVHRALDGGRHRRQARADQRNRERGRPDPFIGSSTTLKRLQDLAHSVVGADVPLLILGETGTGKGVLARWLHDHSPRTSEAFVDLNCAGLSRELAESELFGHRKGSFTGATSDKPGLMELAHHGTMFLDELGDLDLGVQPKLLKALEDRAIRRVGDVQTRPAEVRLIAATHRNLLEMAQAGTFRHDLLFRVNTVIFELPPLRQRPEDIPILARALVERLCTDSGRSIPQLTPEADRALVGYGWPGNARELRNVLERALLLHRSGSLGAELLELVPQAVRSPRSTGTLSLAESERRHVLEVLAAFGGRVDETATALDIPRSSLYAKLKRWGVKPSRI
jgi:DNA-binding NtrC family response regulator